MANVTDTPFLMEYKKHISDFLERELVFDEEVDSWFLMPSSLPVLSIVGAYLLFIYKIGPAYMKDRPPYSLKNIMLFYNLFQTVYNFILVYWFFTTPGALSQVWNNACFPVERSQNTFIVYEIYKGSWYFFISKVLDLLDTIFFVLRKKQSQVTFLHVFHHANMVITVWAYLRFIKGEQATIPAIINSLIHTIMYFYYFLSALGPQMQPYLWWKRYLTKMQITQFVIILLWYFGLVYYRCRISTLYIVYMSADIALFLYLFSKFYKKTYAGKPNAVKKTN